MKNILFTLYFMAKTDYSELRKSFVCANQRGFTMLKLILDMLYCAISYGASFPDYFNFQFYSKNRSQKSSYATMGIMYSFHKKVNDRRFIHKIDDKREFHTNFSEFCSTPYIFNSQDFKRIGEEFAKRIHQKIVIKDPTSTGGKGVQIVRIEKFDWGIVVNGLPAQQFISEFFRNRSTLYFEDYIIQHAALSQLSPTAVNTVRIITLVHTAQQVEVIGAVLRISVDAPIDNYSAGNLAAEIDIASGKVISGGIRKRSSCDVYHHIHPITKKAILGFQLPFWPEILAAVKKAALIFPQVKSVGWDIAVTENGPLIIEGNSN